jgi:NADPH:quinone reductase-like Zn-dependent oxidoreductase
MPVPSGWSYLQAAALPEATLTAYLNLFIEARLQAGERVLVHGGASGVGLAAIKLAKLAGCVVYATAGGSAKVAACLAQGADLALDRHGPPFADAIKSHGAGAGIDVVLDMVGQPYFAANLDLLATKGRIVYISALGGREVTLDIRALMTKRAHLIGSTLRGRPLAEKTAILESFLDRFGPALAGEDLQPVIDSVYPLSETAAAHERMRRNENIGKIVLHVKAGAEGMPRASAAGVGRG